MRDTVDGINEKAWEAAMTRPTNYPSVKTLMQIKDVTKEDAQAIRAVMAGPKRDDNGQSRMQHIDKILNTCGVEYVPCGQGANSPPFYYCNTGDSYAATVVKMRGKFRVTSWGDIVERGGYA